MHFEIIGEIEQIKAIAVGGRIRDIMLKEQREHKFAFCVKNEDCEDLEPRKVYQVLPDKRAESEGYLRIVDDSGEDYLYPESYFVFVKLPRKAQQALVATG